MSVHGCHNCGVDLTKYETYEDSPCSTCKLTKEYIGTYRAALFDSAGDPDNVETPYTPLTDEEAISPAIAALLNIPQVDLLKEVIENQILVVTSNLIIRFVKLAKSNPTLFEIIIKKMQYPQMSYSEIGNSMKDKCSKQNVLYHLKHAVSLFPELVSALLIDTRFSAGKYALQTMANKKRQDACKRKIKGLLYSEESPEFRSMQLKELNCILNAPFMITDDVLDFNPFIQFEEEEESKPEEKIDA